MKKANLYLKIYFVVVGILCIIFGIFFISLWYEDYKNTKYEMEVRRILDEGYRSDEIYIINVGGYIGESTKNEIEYAIIKDKKISYLENIN